MELAEVAPAWIDPGKIDARQLDLTGARAPPQALEARLLDGITTVTRRLAYIGFRAWIIKRYWEARQPDRHASFIAYAKRQEAALAIGLVRSGFVGSNLIGIRPARTAAEEANPGLKPLVKQPAVSIYGASFEALGLGKPGDHRVPRLSNTGAALANAVEARVSGTQYAKLLAGNPSLDSASRNALAKFGEKVGFDEVGENERDLLSNVLFGLDAPPSWLPRRDTYAMLLLRLRKNPEAGDADFLHTSVRPGSFPEILARTVDGWAEYASLDLVAVAHERGLMAIVTELFSLQAGGTRSVAPEVVTGGAASRPAVAELLEELKLPGPDATVAALRQGLAALCRDQSERGGIRRWKSGWTERKIIDALENNPGAGAAGPILAWCCAAHRIAGQRQRQLFVRDGLWSLQGSILPFLDDYADQPADRAMADFLRLVAMQHLRVAWSRYADDPTNNNALIATEQGKWSLVRDYNPQPMGRRLDAARGWLWQLGAWTEDGLSDLGNQLLDRILTKSREAA